MRLKLIFPKRELRDTETVIKHHLVPSETLTAIAAMTPFQHTVEIVDENIQPLDMEDTPDLVGITVYTFVAPRAYALARHFRARGAHVVLGGLHVTSIPEEAMVHADTIFIGEAEALWTTFLHELEQGRPRRVYGPAFADALDGLPQPRKALLAKNRYLTLASVGGSRGCPYRCAYCFNSVEPKPSYRRRSVQSIAHQIQSEGDDYYIFFDDNFAIEPNFTLDLCRELRRLGIKWRCAASINLGYDETLVRTMAESGCDSIFIGFESINPGSLDGASKHHNRRQDYERLIRVFQCNGMLINAAFVFGFDDDTPEVFRETVLFAIKNKLTSINFHILTPFPGTPLFRKLEEEGRILTRDWGQYDTGHVVFRPKHLTPDELLAGYRWAYKEYYSWRNILRRVEAKDLQYGLRTLVFNIALKKMDWIWMILHRCRLLYTAFHLYRRIERLLLRITPSLAILKPRSRTVNAETKSPQTIQDAV
jgi:radical SAM superfamily enzyme YgiQ (UPF0313 family)